MSRQPEEKRTDVIVIYDSSKCKGQKNIKTYNDFFKDPIIIKSDYRRLQFTRPSLDYRGDIRKWHKDRSGRYQSSIMGEIENGVYAIDEEESDEDIIVVYLDSGSDNVDNQESE